MHAQMECWTLTTKDSAKFKQYYFHAKILEVRGIKKIWFEVEMATWLVMVLAILKVADL